MEIYQKLQEKLGDLLRENVELKQYSTFKLGGPAKYFFIAKTREEIIKAAQAARELSLPFFILGGGSNILISDQGFGGLVIKAENRGVEVRKNIIRAEAGASL
ncbi:UDP-N-acetylenolpyruvoylglucosamine reductase, partial [Candidatus Falkowbacteria bacterium CG10_big_fil_rev_8_21_14_0_10_43_10]